MQIKNSYTKRFTTGTALANFAQRQQAFVRRARMKGGTLIGFMLGLVLGLGVAVVVAIFVTRAPIPFMNKTNKAAERVLEGRASNEVPDPNKSMYGKPKATPPVPAPSASGDAGSAPPTGSSGSVLGDILSKENTPPPAPPPIATAPATLPPNASTGKDPIKDPINDAIKDNSSVEDKTRYQLQAGAFRQEEDALSMQAKLALIGFESRVLNAQVKGETLYRVRVGPYKQLEDMNKARGRMVDNKIETTVIKITPAN